MDFLQAVEFHNHSSWFCNDIISKRKSTKILTPPRQLRLTRCKCYITININPSRNERPWRNFKQWSLIVLSWKECNNGASPWFAKNNFFPIESFTSIRLNSECANSPKCFWNVILLWGLKFFVKTFAFEMRLRFKYQLPRARYQTFLKYIDKNLTEAKAMTSDEVINRK